MCAVRLFSLTVKFYLVRDINHSWHQKTRETGLSDSEDRIPLRSLVVTQYRSVTHKRTDGRICRSIYSACLQAIALPRCRNSQRVRTCSISDWWGKSRLWREGFVENISFRGRIQEFALGGVLLPFPPSPAVPSRPILSRSYHSPPVLLSLPFTLRRRSPLNQLGVWGAL